MIDSRPAPEAGASKAAWIPLEVRALGGIAAAQGGTPYSSVENGLYSPIS
ncbi:MAG: hypothetical protein F2842_02535 [Actinobacteria bacterium]|uniref:Unannotated protein n=1 Tax=freshwater metagenome TaxID=449393 RepID=A0A6J7IX69_9ZZZZ|nr:hypothetical protein [Actinomycetota bacterium]